MLIELRVENYAVIDNVVVEFGAGLNLLTGETGAGKSILIDALTLLLGEKASTDVIRHGAEKAVVAAVFDVEPKSISSILEANGIDSDGAHIILRREIMTSGKGRVFINNQPATVAVLKQLAPTLAVVHAQNEAMLAFDPPHRLALLDAAALLDASATSAAFGGWRAVHDRISGLERDEQDRLKLLDLWKFQLKEIEAAAPEAGEDERLQSEKRVLANAERVYGAAMGAYDLLYESANSAAASMRTALKQIEDLARFDTRFQETLQSLDAARITVEDLSEMLRDYAGRIEASPEKLAETEDRLAVLDRLRRKYGSSLAEVIAFADELRGKLNDIENKDEVMRRLRAELATAAELYLKEARGLSRKRYEAARKLEKNVEAEINDLAMKARFKIEVAGSDEEGNWAASGFDSVSYLISANPGEPMGPIEHIASGGELSRVMLALKASVEAGKSSAAKSGSAKKDAPSQRTLVFDEIDAGIGGRAAEAVGKKLKSLSRTKQVLCITHLPQIASFADQHFLIDKKEANGRSKTVVRQLDAAERTHEIARMLSGAKLTEESMRNAEAMLRNGKG